MYVSNRSFSIDNKVTLWLMVAYQPVIVKLKSSTSFDLFVLVYFLGIFSYIDVICITFVMSYYSIVNKHTTLKSCLSDIA